MEARFAHLSEDGLIDEVIVEYARSVNTKAQLAAIGVNELTVETLPTKVINDPMFWYHIVKLEHMEYSPLRDDPIEMPTSGVKSKDDSHKKFDNKTWVQNNTKYLEVEITEEM